MSLQSPTSPEVSQDYDPATPCPEVLKWSKGGSKKCFWKDGLIKGFTRRWCPSRVWDITGVCQEESCGGCSSSSVFIPVLNMTNGKPLMSWFLFQCNNSGNLSLGTWALREGCEIGDFSLSWGLLSSKACWFWLFDVASNINIIFWLGIAISLGVCSIGQGDSETIRYIQ